jgi:hypothetical protein
VRSAVTCFGAILFLCIAVCIAGTKDLQRVVNAKFKFSVAFPADRKVCTSFSGDDPQGFFMIYAAGRTDCENPPSDPEIAAISIFARFNASFLRTPEEELRTDCPNDATAASSRAELRLEFEGRHSAVCRSYLADGTVDIYVATQAGAWPRPHTSPELSAPTVTYFGVLHTGHVKMDDNLQMFRKILRTVRIEYPK